jgi:mRNA interferase MazF
MMKNGVPETGDIIWACLEPVVGHEQGGKYPRPLIVLTPAVHNGPSHRATVVPCTTKGRGMATEIPIGSLPKPCVALIDQITTVDWVDQKAEFREQRVTKAELQVVRRSVVDFITCDESSE